MDGFNASIPDSIFINDFTIIYKGKEEKEGQTIEPIVEIKTSKYDFFKKLRYFNENNLETNNINELYVHDDCSVANFKCFIESIKTKSILLNETNYNIFYKLSLKYQYYELQSIIEEFIKKRPDLQLLVEQLLAANQTQNPESKLATQAESLKPKEIDASKEEIIAKHLDICLQNDNLMQLPISSLHRIFSSPNKILKDHHLLYQFVIKMIEKFESNQNDSTNPNKEDLQLLLGSLDYNKMTNKEIEDLLNKNYLSSAFVSSLPDAKNQKRFQDIEEKIKKIDSFYSEKIQKLEMIQEEKEKKIKEMSIKLLQHEEIIKNFELKLQNLQKVEDNNYKIQQTLPTQKDINQNINQNEVIPYQPIRENKQIEVSSNQPMQKDQQKQVPSSQPIQKNNQDETILNQSIQKSDQNEISQPHSKKSEVQQTQKGSGKVTKGKQLNNKSTLKDAKKEKDLIFDVSSSTVSSSTVSSSSSTASLTSLAPSYNENVPTSNSEKLVIEKLYRKDQFQGIIFELTKFHKGNINDKGIINITGNRDEDGGTFSSLVNYSYIGTNYLSESNPSSYVCFDFKSHKIAISAYSIKSSNQRSADFIISWVLEGSNDNNDWVNIDSHSNDRCLCSKSKSCTFGIQDKQKAEQRYRYIQLRMTGKSPRNNYIFTFANIEFFGKYYSA